MRLTTEFAYEGRWDPVMTWTVENMITDSIVSAVYCVADNHVVICLVPALQSVPLSLCLMQPQFRLSTGVCRCTPPSRPPLPVAVLCVFACYLTLLQEDWMFDVPEPWAAAPKKACKWVMGGWPQIHLFSHYLRV